MPAATLEQTQQVAYNPTLSELAAQGRQRHAARGAARASTLTYSMTTLVKISGAWSSAC